MSESFLKKAIRRSVAYSRNGNSAAAANQSTNESDYQNNDTVYPWLNSLLTKLVTSDSAIFRPSYTWGLLHSAHLARVLGLPRFSAIEFGVAGGNGLVSLDRIALKVEEIFGIGVDVYGFDTGVGLPKPEDYRDLPNLYKEAAFPMDTKKLKSRLKKAQLILGLVADTVDSFVRSNPAPVGFISFDLDYYSSTMHAFKVLEADEKVLLPRIHSYFDDIMGFTHCEFTGERLAISEFNESHKLRKISPIFGLRQYLPNTDVSSGEWPDKFYLSHIFDHSLYGVYDELWRRPLGSWTDLRGGQHR
jgi:hypothetical protein